MGVPKCMEFMQEAIVAAQARAEAVVISLSPARGDTPDVIHKAMELNSIIHTTYGATRNIVICDNTNLTKDGKPLHKYFKDQSSLSSDGLAQISMNLKEAVFTALKDDPYIKAKNAQGLL